MSQTLTIETEPVRRPRADRPEREVHREEGPVIETLASVSPEDALADATRQLGEKDRQLAEQRRLARDADQRRQAAEAQAHNAQAARVGDHQTVVAAALESAKSDQTSARAALRLAREAGDIEAEIAATEQLSSASYRLTQATTELERLKTLPKPTQQQAPSGPSEAAQKWLDDHPRYFTDTAYQADALDAHTAALRRGLRDGSPEYIRHIEQSMTRLYGEDHGQEGGAARSEEPMAQPPRQQSSAAPPARSQGGAPGGYKRVSTLLGPVDVRYSGGKISGVRFTNTAQHENFVEGAKLDKRYEQDPDRALADYAMEQVQIALERAAGGSGDLVTGDGSRFE